MSGTQSSAKEQSTPWQKSSVANLYRYRPSGTYFVRAKVGGKLIRQSLNTQLFTIAKLRLKDVLGAHRQQTEAREPNARDKMTMGEAVALYEEALESNPALKPNAKLYRQKCLQALIKSWPELPAVDVRKVTETECRRWARRFAEAYSASVYNNTVGTLRHLFEIGIKAGLRLNNPAGTIPKRPIRPKKLRLPSQEEFQRMVDAVLHNGRAHSQDAADMIRFLAYGGFRMGEAVNITWADCDFGQGQITVRGDPTTGTKNSEIRIVPMIPRMRSLLEEIQDRRGPEEADARVMRLGACRKSLTHAAAAVGIPRLTHHDLRHLFATRCIESGVDIPTVSRWLGHRDGGSLAMRVYGHLRNQHSLEMAKKVTF